MAAQAEPQQNIKVTVMLYRNPSMSAAEFHDYWSNKHGPLVNPLLKKHGALRVTQYHMPPSHQELAAPFRRPGFEVMDCDGMIEIVVPSMQAIIDTFTDPEYVKNVKPDEDVFTDHARARVMIGYEQVHIDGGEIVGPS